MSADLAIFLAIISIALAGDPVAGTWSIGGEYTPVTGLLGQPSGIAGTHNQYESDASIVRGDAYLNGVSTAHPDVKLLLTSDFTFRATSVFSSCVSLV